MSKKTKLYDQSLLSALRQTIVVPTETAHKEGVRFNKVGDHSGLFNTITAEPRVNFIVAANQVLLSDRTKNAAIVIGADRPAGKASGYGGKGAMKANTIDLVVGRMSSNKKLKDNSFVNNSFSGDAARIYISQLTDIDLNFGIEPGQSGKITARSGIGIKADAVRLIGREGIKIVTGRSFAFKGHGLSGETNSRGGKISQPAPPIELIAGNLKSDQGFLGVGPEKRILQGIAKGENTRDSLRELSGILDEMWSVMFNMGLYNVILFSGIGVNYWHPTYAALCGQTISKYMTDMIAPLWMTRINKAFWDVNYLQPFGDKYVVSRNVFAT